MTLKRWEEFGWLKAEATSPAEINNLLEITIRAQGYKWDTQTKTAG